MIFVIGISKTGLTSVTIALRHLRYRGLQHISLEAGERIINGTYERKLDFLCDMPVMKDFDIFDRTFPNSKFIVTHRRDNEAWIDSNRNQRLKQKSYDKNRYVGVNRIKMYGTYDFDIPILLDVKERHYKRIDDYFKDRPQDVLHMNIIEDGDGWEKLCPFLDKPIPNTPFPHENKTNPEYKGMEIP